MRDEKRAALGILIVGILLLGSAVAMAFLRRGDQGVDAAFRQRSLDYVATFADAAGGWLQEGEFEMLQDAAKFMLLGSAAFVEVVGEDEAVVRESRGDLSPPPFSGEPPAVSFIERDRGRFLEVVYPLTEGNGYVRVWLELPYGGGSPLIPILTGILSFLGLGAVGGSLYLRLRRPAPKPQKERKLIRVGSLVIDEVSKEVKLCGKAIRLSPKQYALLLLLAREPGRVFSDREILRELWPESRYANSKDVKQYVYLLRRRLGEVVPGAEALVATVPGFGYKLLPPEEIGLTGR